MAVIEPQSHEFRGNMLFDSYSDKPYWALRSIFSHEINGGVKNVDVEVDGEQWTVSLSHQESGLQPHVTQWELYVRIQRAMARKIVKMDGILWRIFHLLGNLEGSKFVYSNDNTKILGYNHQVRVDTKAAREIMPGRQRGKQFEHYHPQHVRGE